MSFTMTVAPATLRLNAQARPMPEPAPVTTTTFSFRVIAVDSPRSLRAPGDLAIGPSVEARRGLQRQQIPGQSGEREPEPRPSTRREQADRAELPDSEKRLALSSIAHTGGLLIR